MQDVGGAVGPGYVGTDGSLGFAYHHCNTVDDIDKVDALAPLMAGARELPLIGDHATVFRHIIAEKADVDIVAVGTEGI